MKYSKKTIELFNNPTHAGSLDEKDKNVGVGISGAAACGDVMKIHLKVNSDGKIDDVKFQTFGCVSAIAASEYVSELIKGKSIEDASNVTNTQIAEDLALPPIKIHCSVLAEEAIKNAIEDIKHKKLEKEKK